MAQLHTLLCWQPNYTSSLPPVYTAVAPKNHQSTRCYLGQLTATLSTRHDPTFSFQTTRDAIGAYWRGSEWWHHPHIPTRNGREIWRNIRNFTGLKTGHPVHVICTSPYSNCLAGSLDHNNVVCVMRGVVVIFCLNHQTAWCLNKWWWWWWGYCWWWRWWWWWWWWC